jgi:hypothetical protein
MSLRSFSAVIFIFLTCLLSGCFSTLQIAKVEDGFSLTGGVYTYTAEMYDHPNYHYENHFLLILMPRYGWPAKEKRWGFEGGIRVVSDWIDPDYPQDPVWLFLDEFKVQIPKNRHLDLAFGADFLLIIPGSVYILASKDVNETLTLYGGLELFGALYSLTLGENEAGFFPKVTLGSEINLYKNLSALVEMERWFATGWDPWENTRFAVAMKITPGKFSKWFR